MAPVWFVRIEFVARQLTNSVGSGWNKGRAIMPGMMSLHFKRDNPTLRLCVL